MPILTDSTGKQYERSEAQIERMSAPPVSGPPLTKEQRKKFNADVREYYREKGYPVPDEYKD